MRKLQIINSLTPALILGFVFTIFSFIPSAQAQVKTGNYSLNQLLDSLKLTMKKQHIVGLTLGITTSDSIIFSGGLGYADLENKKPVNSQTLFRMGSITKMVISVAIMQLVEKGKLKLNDELKKITPEIPIQNNWEKTQPLRVVHLLEHTSGFDDMKLNQMYDLKPTNLDSKGKLLAHQASFITRWPPGERMAYSNPNYTILGFLIEKISGQNYESYIKEHIFRPLQMNSANLNLSSQIPEKDTREYAFEKGKIQKVPSVAMVTGAPGAMWASADDMIKFLQFFLKNEKEIISAQSIQEIETPHSSLAAKKGLKSGYALGNRSAHINSRFRFRGHDGLVGACFSGFYYSRDLGVGFVVSGNSNQNLSKVESLIINYLDINFGKNTPPKTLAALPINPSKIQAYLGYYQFESPRNASAGFRDKLLGLNQIYLEGNQLYFKPLFGNTSELFQLDSMAFGWKGMNRPLVLFTENEAQKRVMLIGGTYYEKVNFWEAWAFRSVAIVAILFSLSSLLMGLTALIRGVMRKLKWKVVFWRFLPSVAIGLLVWGVMNIVEIEEFTYKLYELRNITYRSLAIFIGTLGFGICSLLSAGYFIWTFRQTKPRFLAIYLLLVGLSMLFLTAFLATEGWIGLRTWAI